MIRVRRYRVFLFVTIVSILGVYYYSTGSSWGGSETLAQLKGYGSALTGQARYPLEKDSADPQGVVPPANFPQIKLQDDTPQVGNKLNSITATTSISTSNPSPSTVQPKTTPLSSTSITKANAKSTTSTISSSTAASLGSATKTLPRSTKSSQTSPTHTTTTSFIQEGRGRLEVSATGPPVYWMKPLERYPVASESFHSLPTAGLKTIPRIQAIFSAETSTERSDREEKLGSISKAFKRTWTAYTKYAWMHDELRPLAAGFKGPGYAGQGFRDPFGGWAATLIDSLDTLWIMGMIDEFEDAVNATNEIDFTTSPRDDIPIFETVIRYLGGLLGAYDISGQEYDVLLMKATELGEIMMDAFDTPNRMPVTYYLWKPESASKSKRAGAGVVLAELGSLSVEFTRLAQLTGQDQFYDAVAKITDELETWQARTKLAGLWPLFVDATGCNNTNTTTSTTVSGGAVRTPATDPIQDGLDQQKDTSSFGIDRVDETEEAIPDAKQLHQSNDAASNTDQRKDTSTFGTDRMDVTDAINKTTPDPKQLYRDKDLSSFGQDSTEHTKRDVREIPLNEAECVSVGLQESTRVLMGKYTLGAMADSTYEYLPKEHILLGGANNQYQSMYESMMTTVNEYLLYRPMTKDDRDILFTGSYTPVNHNDETGRMNGFFEATTGHLSCFLGGMFGLGAKIFNRPDDMETAIKLTEGCVWAYESTITGIMPEEFTPMACDSMTSCKWNETKWLDEVETRGRKNYAKRLSDAQRANRDAAIAANQTTVEALGSTPAGDFQLDNSAEVAELSLSMPGAPPVDSHINFDDFKKKRQLEDISPDPVDQAADPSSPVEDESLPAEQSVPTTKPTTLPPQQAGSNSSLPAMTREELIANELEYEGLWSGIIAIDRKKYILRPEAIESVFYMYRLTGDESWRAKGWTMFQAIELHTRTDVAYSAIDDVTSDDPIKTDEMESFWTAETLKYFYLLFSEPSVVSLDDYVLNTEAHPLLRPDAKLVGTGVK